MTDVPHFEVRHLRCVIALTQYKVDYFILCQMYCR